VESKGGSECNTYAALAARVFNRTAATTMLEDLQIMLDVWVVRKDWCGVVKEWEIQEIESVGVTRSDQHLEWKSSAGEHGR